MMRFERLEERIALSFSGTCSAPFAVNALALDAWDGAGRAAYVHAADADGDTPRTAINLGVLDGTETINGSVGPADRNDYYRFEITAETEVDIQLTGLAQDVDLYVYDAAGRQLGRSIRPADQSESFTRTLAAGTYQVLVTPFGSHASSYRLNLEAASTAAPPSDGGGSGDSFGDARNLGSLEGPKSIRDWVGRTDGVDYYRFTLDRDGVVDLGLSGLKADVDLYLYHAGGRELARSWNGGASNESIHASLDAGQYVVLVKPWGSAESAYSLSMQASLAQPPTEPTPGPQPTPDPAPEPAPDPEPGTDVPFPDVPDFGGPNDWNLNRINAPEAWAQGHTGEGVVVAVVDTGVDGSHRELTRSMWVNPGEIPGNGIDDDGNGYVDDVAGWDFVADDNTPNDANGHGTHVAGTIAAANDGYGSTGVAFDATIMPVRVLDAGGSGSIYDVAAGIRYAVDNGADVINLSLGGGYSSVLYSALAYAAENGVFVVAAAGNESAVAPGYPASFSSRLTNVLSVGAFDSADSRASFSNRVGTSGALQVDAPGVGIYSSLPGNRYALYSGTSMATPHVAGLAALALSANPGLTPEALRTLIVDGADHSVSGSDSIGGINVAQTVARAAGYTAQSQGQAAVDGFLTSLGSPSYGTQDFAAFTDLWDLA
jgi:subtilisin family serine protease